MRSTLSRFTLFIVLWAAIQHAHAETWDANDFSVNIGTQEGTGQGLTLRPNEQGQILVGVPVAGTSLDDNYRVAVHYSGARPTAIYVVWSNNSQDQLHQRGAAPQSLSETTFDMRGVPGWAGTGRTLEIGLLVPGNQAVTISKISLNRPGLADKARAAWDSWLAFRPWQGYDVNVHTGTRSFTGEPYPVAVVAFAGLLLGSLYFLLRRGRARFLELGVILFCLWLALDGLWQLRLWRQVSVTLDQYWGLTPREKLMASEDAVFARLGERVRETVPDPEARVFIATSSDPWGMLSAYYVSPLNTYWHRRGPELPPAENLRAGDYILLLAGSKLQYQPNQKYLQVEQNREIAVEQRFADRAGYLLEVQ